MSSIPKRKREKKSAAVSAENVSQVLTGFYGLKTAGVYVSPSTALQCSAVFACIGLLAESISQGVPCLSAYTSSFFDYDDDLKQKLVIDGFDDSWHIYRKIDEVLKDRDAIGKQCIEYAKRLNVLAGERLNEFLNN